MERQIAALLCRTSERGEDAAVGTRELAELQGARIIGSPGEPHPAGHLDDLRGAHGCLLEAGGQVDDALEAGRVPILLAGECSVCVSTLPPRALLEVLSYVAGEGDARRRRDHLGGAGLRAGRG